MHHSWNLTRLNFSSLEQKGHLRTVQATRSISKITSNFFHTLDVHASTLSKILEESQTVQDKRLHELEKKFEAFFIPYFSLLVCPEEP